jgi:hypothetical protein
VCANRHPFDILDLPGLPKDETCFQDY